MITRIRTWWNALTPSTKGLIIIGLISILGIIMRWRHVMAGLAKGFNYYGGYAN